MATSQTRSDAGLATELRISVSRLARRLRAERIARGLATELSDTQLAALAALERHAAMTPGELAEHEKVQPPSMTRVISALLERALVARAPHPTDGRQVILSTTDAGRAVVAETGRARDEWLARRLAVLTAEERDTLKRAADILGRLGREH